MNPSILIIEDDPDGARSVKEAAADAGFDVTLAATGRDGLAWRLRDTGMIMNCMTATVAPNLGAR